MFKEKILIIGYGSIGERHARLLSKIVDKKNIYIHTSRKIKSFKVISSLSDAIISTFDYVVISNTTNIHFKTLKRIRSVNIDSKILIEKPVFNKLYDLSNIKNQSNIYVGYNLRFHPVILDTIKFLKNKNILFFSSECHSNIMKWRKRKFSNTYSSSKSMGGGVEYELSHELDLLLLFNPNIKKLSEVKKKISHLKYKINDIFLASGRIGKNKYFQISLSLFSNFEKRSFLMIGNNWTIEGDFINNQLMYTNKKIKKLIKYPNHNIDKTYSNQHINILENNKKNLCTLDQSIKVLKLII